MNKITFAVILTLIFTLFSLTYIYSQKANILENELYRLKYERERLIEENRRLEKERDELYKMKMDIAEVKDILTGASWHDYTITAYAPFDSRAIEGMCYSGDPNGTASGKPPLPGETAAATLPFGTRVFIPGKGIYEVNDRGPGVGHIDLCVESREEAFGIGRYEEKVLVWGD